MEDIFTLALLAVIIITLWTAFALFNDKRTNPQLKPWFIGFLLALSLLQIDIYCAHVIPNGVYWLSLVSSTFLFLKGPFLWGFICVLTRQNARLRRLWPHFMPWAVAMVLWLTMPGQWALWTLAGITHMLIYLVGALLLLITRRRYLHSLWQGFQTSSYYWVLYLVAGLMLLVAIDWVVIVLVMLQLIQTFDLLTYFVFPLFSLYAFSIGLLSVYCPEILVGPAATESVLVTSLRSESEVLAASERLTSEFNGELVTTAASEPAAIDFSCDSTPRYRELDAGLAQSVMPVLQRLMQEQELYRQNQLSLADLAIHLDLSVHQVSELLNVHCGVTFYDYINRHRLEYARRLLGDPNCYLRILDVAFEAGFNNKNSFYRSFKQVFGVTPNQYRSSAQVESVI